MHCTHVRADQKMTDEIRKQIAARIKSRLERLAVKIAQLEELSAPVSPENSIGRISRMDAINNKAIYESALREAKKEMNELSAAQRKLDEPDFGNCEKCGTGIDVRRLMIMPGSKYCMRCAR